MQCERPRLLYSNHKLKDRQLKVLKIFISKIIYICGSTLSEYNGTENREEEKISESVFSRENFSCQSKIELPYYSIDLSIQNVRNVRKKTTYHAGKGS